MSFPGTASQLAGLQTSKYFNIAGLAILIFDYAITLENEARWVWGRGWDMTRFVFTLSRYIPFAGAGMTAYVALRSNSDPCGPSSGQSSLIIHMLGIIAAEVLLILRMYAFWQGDKRVLYGLLAYGGVTIVASVGISLVPGQLIPGAQAPPGCYLTAGRNGTFVYLFLMLFEMVILFLMVYKYIRCYREVQSSIVRTIYRDGMVYIACIILITLANTIADGALPFQFSDLLETAQITLHSVLASRIMFNLRQSSQCQQQEPTMDSIVFNDGPFHPALSSLSSESSHESESSKKGSWGLMSICVDIEIDLPWPESSWGSSISRV